MFSSSGEMVGRNLLRSAVGPLDRANQATEIKLTGRGGTCLGPLDRINSMAEINSIQWTQLNMYFQNASPGDGNRPSFRNVMCF
jgi:hypothetical protein